MNMYGILLGNIRSNHLMLIETWIQNNKGANRYLFIIQVMLIHKNLHFLNKQYERMSKMSMHRSMHGQLVFPSACVILLRD
jgi:hypothetical protein